MTHIESEKVEINGSSVDLFNYLLDMNNILPLLPEEKVENWKGETESCSFTIKGLAGIGMKRKSKEEHSKITFVSHGKNPFDFTLSVLFNKVDENKTESHIEFDANMNMMVEMMAKTPLTNLFNIMAQNLQKKFG